MNVARRDLWQSDCLNYNILVQGKEDERVSSHFAETDTRKVRLPNYTLVDVMRYRWPNVAVLH